MLPASPEKCLTGFSGGTDRYFQHLARKPSLAELRAFFTEDIAARIIGITPLWQEIPEIVAIVGYQRHAEIEGWLRHSGQPLLSWLAIDDKPYLFRPFLKNLIKTNSLTGFDAETEVMLRQSLAASTLSATSLC